VQEGKVVFIAGAFGIPEIITETLPLVELQQPEEFRALI
jgi:hypothetical protein